MIRFLKTVWRRGGRIALILAFLAGVAWAAGLFPRPGSIVSAASLQPLSLDGIHRLLVLAPHNDDETLGPGGLILGAVRAGIDVRVVIATNGDGSMSTEIGNFHKIRPHARDFIQMGNIRQQESLAALQVLGVGPDNVYFLSYPDRGTPELWSDHWSAKDPYRSPYNGDTRSPYQLTYDPAAVYAGEDFLGDLMAIMRDFRPDMIIYPHPEDVHPDHWGLNVFTRLGIALLEKSDPSFQPQEFTYLVHRNDFPTLRGYHPTADLIPPPALYAINPDWYRWDLTPEDTAIKYEAVLKYRSQLPTLRSLMVSFVRSNELFAPVADVRLPDVIRGVPLNPTTWSDRSGRPVAPIQVDPVHDVIVRQVVPAADLVAVYAARAAGDALWLCAETDEKTAEDVNYSLHLKALTDTGVVDYGAITSTPKPGWGKAIRSGKYVCNQVNLSSLGMPYAIFVAASSIAPGGYTLDQSAWQVASLDPSMLR